MAALLEEVGGREIDDHPLGRQRETHGGEGGAHPLARLADRLVGQADDQEGREPRRDLHLDLDRHRLDPGKREGGDARDAHRGRNGGKITAGRGREK